MSNDLLNKNMIIMTQASFFLDLLETVLWICSSDEPSQWTLPWLSLHVRKVKIETGHFPQNCWLKAYSAFSLRMRYLSYTRLVGGACRGLPR